jgi:hypothetical protein
VSSPVPDGRAVAHPPDPGASGPKPAELDGVSADELEVLLRVASILRQIRFGTVLIVVQDGKVVQIETAEKHRLR